MTDLPCKRPGCDFPRQTWTKPTIPVRGLEGQPTAA